MTPNQAQQFAAEWVAAWNRHDVDAVLAHYADDFTMTTPMIQKLLGVPTGTRKGKQPWAITGALRSPRFRPAVLHHRNHLRRGPASAFYYNAVLGRRAIETFFSTPRHGLQSLATYDA
jgi:hypothetical protein